MSKLLLNESCIELDMNTCIILGAEAAAVLELVRRGHHVTNDIVEEVRFLTKKRVVSALGKLSSNGYVKESGSHDIPKKFFFVKFPNQSDLLEYKNSYKCGFVYFAISNISGLVKIGMTKDVDERLKNLSRKHGELRLLKSIEVSDARYYEKLIHDKFGDFNVFGEWFLLSPESIKEITEGVWGYEK